MAEQANFTDHTEGFNYPPGRQLMPGHVIVMWDGKWFGTYNDLPDAKVNAEARLRDPKQYFDYDDDVEALEFLEVEGPPEEPQTINLGTGRNQHGQRVSFGMLVKELGNPLLDRNQHG